MNEPRLVDLHWTLLSLLEARLDREADTGLEPLVRRIASISERELRRLKLARLINGSCTRLGYRVLRWLWESRSDVDPLAREMLLDLLTTRPLTESLGYDRVRDLYAASKLEGPSEMGRLFLTTEAKQKRRGYRADEENVKMGSVSLGLRKAYARGRDRFKLDRLLFDRNSAVIRHLLRNPRLVEMDAVRIAALRPTNPDCIVEVYRSGRWVSRYSVKKAIAFNPYTPVDIAVAVLPHLVRQDVVDLSRSRMADEQVRIAAAEVLRERAKARRSPTGRSKAPERKAESTDGGDSAG